MVVLRVTKHVAHEYLAVMKYYLIALGGACAVTEMPTALLCQGQCATAEDVEYAEMQDVNTFLWPLSP